MSPTERRQIAKGIKRGKITAQAQAKDAIATLEQECEELRQHAVNTIAQLAEAHERERAIQAQLAAVRARITAWLGDGEPADIGGAIDLLTEVNEALLRIDEAIGAPQTATALPPRKEG